MRKTENIHFLILHKNQQCLQGPNFSLPALLGLCRWDTPTADRRVFCPQPHQLD